MSRSQVIPGVLDIIGVRASGAGEMPSVRNLAPLPPTGPGKPAGSAPLPPVPSWSDPERKADRSPLTSIFPQMDVIEAWFDGALPLLPDPFNIGSTESAWFGLQRVRIPKDFGQEILLYGVSVDLAPPDTDGTGGAGAIGWGTTRGTGAAIVIGMDLPIQLGSWRQGPGSIPRVETGATTSGPLTDRRQAAWIDTFNFPSGKLSDTTPTRLIHSRNYSPAVYRITNNHSLDVALVVRGTQLSGSGIRQIYGSGKVVLNVMRSNSLATLME